MIPSIYPLMLNPLPFASHTCPALHQAPNRGAPFPPGPEAANGPDPFLVLVEGRGFRDVLDSARGRVGAGGWGSPLIGPTGEVKRYLSAYAIGGGEGPSAAHNVVGLTALAL